MASTSKSKACTCVPRCWSHPVCTLTTRVPAPEDEGRAHSWADVSSVLPTAVASGSDEPTELVSRRLSRPLTIFEALVELKLVPTPAPLRIHLLGADGREGRGKVATTEVFRPLCALLRGQCPEVRLLLCGPNCSENDFSSMEMEWGKPAAPAPPAGTPTLAIEYSSAYYHEYAAAVAVRGGRMEPPQLAVAFNAGVWGYDSWAESVRYVHHALGAPLLVTSYNADEADADEEALEAMGVAWAWRPRSNHPWRSLVPEPRKGDFAPQYENDHTQCLRREGEGAQEEAR